MYQDELAHEARLIARGHQEFVSIVAERWSLFKSWLGLLG